MPLLKVIGEIPVPNGNRAIIVQGAFNTVSIGDVCEGVFAGTQVQMVVISIGMRSLDRVQAGIALLLIETTPPEAPSLIGETLSFESVNQSALGRRISTFSCASTKVRSYKIMPKNNARHEWH